MSSYSRKSQAENIEDYSLSSKKVQRSLYVDTDCNVNGNNNTDSNEYTKTSLSLTENGKRHSGNKNIGRSRKSKLIEAMAANFEKKNTDSQPIKNIARRTMSNIEVKTVPLIVEPPKDERDDVDDDSPTDETNISTDDNKISPSARRGKNQRSKRMIRQKRRSTGVVNKEDIEDVEQPDATEAEENLQLETDVNTQTNELSPVANSATSERLQVDDWVFTYNPRKNVDVVSSNDQTDQMKLEIDELRLKLQTAETTISRLRQEIKIMDKELHTLEEENDHLKEENKMLEDENKTMLRLIRR